MDHPKGPAKFKTPVVKFEGRSPEALPGDLRGRAAPARRGTGPPRPQAPQRPPQRQGRLGRHHGPRVGRQGQGPGRDPLAGPAAAGRCGREVLHHLPTAGAVSGWFSHMRLSRIGIKV